MSSGFPTDPQYDPAAYLRSQPAAASRSRTRNWLLGLVLVFLSLFVLGGIVVVGGVCYVAANLESWIVGLGREAIVAMINESEIPAEEKAEVITQVDRVVTAYKVRKINQSDLEKALHELGDAPAMKVLVLYGLDKEFLTSTGLSEDEIAAGRRAYERALRGVYEDKFTTEDLYAALPLDADAMPDTGSNQDSKNAGENITLVANSKPKSDADDNIREAIAKLKLLADNAGIPDEPFRLDIGDEVKKIVDHLLEGKNEPQ
jgi:hypothetical protein